MSSSRRPFSWTDDVADQLTGGLPHVACIVDGEAAFRVPLQNQPGTWAILCKHGYELLVARGVDLLIGTTMPGGQTYVQALRPGFKHRWEQASRLIAGATKGQIVRHISGDRADLRLTCLRLQQTKGAAA
jgi:hypothetical protein